jgi:hypothetical protein
MEKVKFKLGEVIMIDGGTRLAIIIVAVDATCAGSVRGGLDVLER